MKITVWVESEETGMETEKHQFIGRYHNVLEAEAGLREMVEKYMRIVPPTVDPATGEPGPAQEEKVPF